MYCFPHHFVRMNIEIQVARIIKDKSYNSTKYKVQCTTNLRSTYQFRFTKRHTLVIHFNSYQNLLNSSKFLHISLRLSLKWSNFKLSLEFLILFILFSFSKKISLRFFPRLLFLIFAIPHFNFNKIKLNNFLIFFQFNFNSQNNQTSAFHSFTIYSNRYLQRTMSIWIYANRTRRIFGFIKQ